MLQLVPVFLLVLNLCVFSLGQDSATGTTAETSDKTTPETEKEISPIADPLALLGQAAPPLVLKGIDGESYDLSDHSDEIIVLEWILPECRFARRLYGQHRIHPMIRRWGKQKVQWISIDSAFFAHPEKIRPWAEKQSIKHPFLIDQDGRCAEAFGVKVSPTYIVVNRGQIVYHGSLDDDVWGRKLDRKLYLDDAIREAVDGNPVTNSLTRPYGMKIRTRRVEDDRRAKLAEAQEKASVDDPGKEPKKSVINSGDGR
ncbi:MAG: redoxin domain-containing protein [Planctomycetota bacterium]